MSESERRERYRKIKRFSGRGSDWKRGREREWEMERVRLENKVC